MEGNQHILRLSRRNMRAGSIFFSFFSNVFLTKYFCLSPHCICLQNVLFLLLLTRCGMIWRIYFHFGGLRALVSNPSIHIHTMLEYLTVWRPKEEHLWYSIYRVSKRKFATTTAKSEVLHIFWPIFHLVNFHAKGKKLYFLWCLWELAMFMNWCS